MHILKKLLHSYTFFVIFSVMFLYLGYSLNLWKATRYKRHNYYPYSFMKNFPVLKSNYFSDSLFTCDYFNESMVLGRLVKSRKDGLLSSGGFVGRFYDFSMSPEEARFIHFDNARKKRLFLRGIHQAFQYMFYFDDSFDNLLKKFITYESQFGGQALVFSILDKIIPGTNIFKIQFYYHLMAFMTAIIVFLIIFWFYKEFGIFTGWFLVLCFALMHYPTHFAKSLWWILWAFYVPFLLIIYALRKEEISKTELSFRSLLFLGLCGVFIKIFFNGFEFITSTLIMTTIPFFYYAFKNKWKFKLLFYRLSITGGGIFLATIISFLIISLQHVLAGESFYDGLNQLFTAFLRRSHSIAHDVSGFDADLIKLLKYYFRYPIVFDFRDIGLNFILTMWHFLFLFLLITPKWTLCYRRFINSHNFDKILALTITFWISILAPISWFIIFKQHSYLHKYQDPLVWYMPFMFYGLALTGIAIEKFAMRILPFEKKFNKLNYSV